MSLFHGALAVAGAALGWLDWWSVRPARVRAVAGRWVDRTVYRRTTFSVNGRRCSRAEADAFKVAPYAMPTKLPAPVPAGNLDVAVIYNPVDSAGRPIKGLLVRARVIAPPPDQSYLFLWGDGQRELGGSMREHVLTSIAPVGFPLVRVVATCRTGVRL